MKYELLMFISERQLSAIDINDEGVTDNISLDGNDVLEYSNQADIDQFCYYIKDYYNIDMFSDIDINITIVTFGMCYSNYTYLFECVKEATMVNLIDAKVLLPVLLLKTETVQNNKKYHVISFETSYCIKVDENYQCIYLEEEKNSEILNISIEQYKLILKFDCNHLIDDKKKYQEIENTFLMEKKKSDKEYQNMLEKYNVALKEIETLKKDLQKSQEELKKVIDVENKNKSRTICRCHIIKREPTGYKGIASMLGGSFETIGAKYKIHNIFRDGDIVKKDTHIAKIQQVYGEEVIRDNISLVKANASGRIFFLKKNNEYVKDNDIVAIIGVESDTRADVMEWYKKICEEA